MKCVEIASERKTKQAYKPDYVNVSCLRYYVGNHSSRPDIAVRLKPSTRILGRAALGVCLFDVAPDRGYRVSPCSAVTEVTPYGSRRISVYKYTHTAVSSLWPYSSLIAERTAVSRYLALWSPDFPRA